MRQTHVAGEKLFVDWAGDPEFDPITGAEHGARIFIAALDQIVFDAAASKIVEHLVGGDGIVGEAKDLDHVREIEIADTPMAERFK